MTRLWSRLRAGWVTLTGSGAVASVAFGLLVFASVLASLAIPREGVALRNEALQHVIAAAPSADRAVLETAGETFMKGPTGTVLAGNIAALGTSMRAQLTAHGVPLASDPPAWSGLTTGYAPADGVAKAPGYGQPQLQMIYRSALASYSHVVAGQLPAGGTQSRSQTLIQAAVTTATAARFGLRVGTRLTAGPADLVVTAIIEPTEPATAFWGQDLVADAPELNHPAPPLPPYWAGAVFISPGALPLVEAVLDNDQMTVSWVYQAALARLTAGQAGRAEASIATLAANGTAFIVPGVVDPVTGAPQPVSVTVSSQIPSLLAPFLSGESAAAPVLGLLYVSLAVLGAVVVLLGARLVAQRRAGELTLMRARGAALYQLGWLVLRASVVIAAAAGAAAAALAIGLTPGDADPVGWWLAGATIVVTVTGPVLISVGPLRVATPVAGRTRRRASGRRVGGRIVIEAALAAVAIGGLVVLRNQGLSSGDAGLYTSAAPVLISIPVAVVMLRGYPPLARQLARLAGLSRGVVAFVGLARATRAPADAVLPSFALVLVLAMMAFPDMISTSVTQSQVAASWQQVGADAIITAPSHGGIPAGLEGQVSSVPGVVSAVAAQVDPGVLPDGNELPVVFVDPAQYAAVVGQAPGPPFPVAALTASPGPGQAFPAFTTAAAAPVVGTAPVSITDGNAGNAFVTIRAAGQISGVPGVPGGAIVLVPRQALGVQPLEPNLLLVAGSGLDRARLGAVVRRALPGGVGHLPRRGPRRADHGTGSAGGAGGAQPGNGRSGRIRRADPAAAAADQRQDPGDDAGAPGHDGVAAPAGPVAAGDRDPSPRGGRRHRWRRVRLAARATGRAVPGPGRVQRDGSGHRGDPRRIAAGRLGGRAGARRTARPGRPGRDHLPARQHQGAADRRVKEAP